MATKKKFILGMDAKTFYSTTLCPVDVEAGNGSMAIPETEISCMTGGTLNLEAGKADVTTRGNGGWRATVSTLKTCTFEFKMLHKVGDPSFAVIRSAFLHNEQIFLAILTGEKGEGPCGDFSITSFSRGEELEEGITYDVTAELTVFDHWEEAKDS